MPIPFVPAKNFTQALEGRPVRWLVLHSMENPEKPTAAEDVAMWFAGPRAPQGSAHVCVDSDSAVQSVRLRDVAWGAPGANRAGVHIEHAGWANQTADDWRDPFSLAMLKISAKLGAEICDRYDLPVLFVPAEGILKGQKGITTHAEVSLAFKTPGGHTDPGPHFPMEIYLSLAGAAFGERGLALDQLI